MNLPESAHPRCIDCDLPVDTDNHLSLQEVTGFAKKRSGGGQNHVLYRKETGRWLCFRCVIARRHHVNAEQGSLL